MAVAPDLGGHSSSPPNSTDSSDVFTVVSPPAPPDFVAVEVAAGQRVLRCTSQASCFLSVSLK